MFKAKILVPTGLLVLFLYLKFVVYQLPAERQQIVFKDSAKSVQDSMQVLRQICEAIEPEQFMNCVVQPWDSIMYFRQELIGKLDTISTANRAFNTIKKKDAQRIISLIRYLNHNFISGIYHDTSIGFWLYPYRENIYYNSGTGIRSIYIFKTPKDTLGSAFKYYLEILDRREKLLLLAHNDVQYRKF